MGLSSTQKGILYAVCGYFMFSLSDICTKWLGRDYEVTEILFWSFLVTLFFCVTFAIPTGVVKTFKTPTLAIHIARSICGLFCAACVVAALAGGLSLATFYTIVFLFPSVAAIAAIPIYKERVSKKSMGIILLGFAGVVVAFHKEVSFFNWQILYAFGVLVFGTAITFFARPIGKEDNILTFPFYSAVVLVVAIPIYTLGNIGMPDPVDIPVFVLRGFGAFVGMSAALQSYRIAPYATVAPIQYSQMIYGLIVGYYLFGDIPSGWTLAGAGLVIISGCLLIMQKRKAENAAD